MMETLRYHLIVIGVSAGGTTALKQLLPMFPSNYPIPIIVVQHLHPTQENTLLTIYDAMCGLKVKEADEKEPIQPGYIYFAAPNYHLLIENNRTFAFSIDEKVNYARPAIDVLFECAVDVYGGRVIGIVLTGANNDGAAGLRLIKDHKGLAIVQDPATAEVAYMPKAAMEATQVDYSLSLKEIGELLLKVRTL
jgi:two-component system chemotaxis response regulator CheB